MISDAKSNQEILLLIDELIEDKPLKAILQCIVNSMVNVFTPLVEMKHLQVPLRNDELQRIEHKMNLSKYVIITELQGKQVLLHTAIPCPIDPANFILLKGLQDESVEVYDVFIIGIKTI